MKNGAKIQKTYNYLIRLIILAATYGFLYRQVFFRRNLDEVFGTFREFFGHSLFRNGLLLVLLMMLINWGLESMKWKILITRIEKISFLKSFEAVFSGVMVSIFLPNRSGEFLGRVFILEKANRIEGSLITIIGSLSQVIITISMGFFGFLAFYYQYLIKNTTLFNYIGAGLVLFVPVLVFFLLFLYFNMRFLTPVLKKIFWGRWKKYTYYTDVFSAYSFDQLMRVLVLSFVRYLVFSTQFYLLLLLFGVSIPFPQAIILISVNYLFLMILPSFALTELGIRCSLAVYLFSLYLWLVLIKKVIQLFFIKQVKVKNLSKLLKLNMITKNLYLNLEQM